MNNYTVAPCFGRWAVKNRGGILAILPEEEKARSLAALLNEAIMSGELRTIKTARWKRLKNGRFICSSCCCGETYKRHFCANCGAVMEWGDE